MRSIERSLLAWTLGVLLAGTLVVSFVAYRVMLQEINEIYDSDLRNVAEALGRYRPADPSLPPEPRPRPAVPQPGDLPAVAEIVTLAWTLDGRRVYASDPRVPIPFMAEEALRRITAGGEEWIVYTDVSDSGVAQAAQRAAARRVTAVESASRVFPPLVGLALVASGLMVLALRRGLKPLDAAARIVAERSAGALRPIEVEPLPREIAPLVGAVNGLLARLAAALGAQRRFLAEAAHELRTPVTALQLQLQWLQRAGDAAARREAMAELEAGIARSRRLVEQLLEVAHTDPDEPDAPSHLREPVDLAELARSVVGTLSAKAEPLGIDLGASGEPGIRVLGDPHQLTVLLNNLVENALRYTPAGGVVDVEALVDEGAPVLRVVDSGPGIPEDERELVFQRFYRGRDARALARDPGGSGLGLSIVKAVAQQHGAAVELRTPDSGRGLEVRVRFAAAS